MIVKLNYPSSWNFQSFDFLPAIFETNDIILQVNDDCEYCDYWIIWGNIDERVENVYVDPNKLVFIAEEAYPEKVYPQPFIDQFSMVVGTRNDIYHKNFERKHYTGSWFIHKTYNQLLSVNPHSKVKNNNLSIITSDLVLLDGHKKRFAFVNQLIGHFKERLHVYGRGFNPIVDKSKGLDHYKYSIAIENSVIEDYFTEKIWDCFLCFTMPFYFGCPNIENYFPLESYIQIDINDYKKSLEIIENAILNDRYAKSLEAIIHSRELVLKKYSITPFIHQIINETNKLPPNIKKKMSISPISSFSRRSTFFNQMQKLIK